ncbi:N-acetylmuramoyl-L-alanine amidase [Nocardioides sp. SOB77]|uniref:N-acetylmuramoyl-L-alanine amidase n=1 Tax=Nocardioides oceani TaxID=3058369 RepID=A0ABT8FJN5_9ACTN|nr:N-acetylmuramoyl-L-alanine amidase [Nocardioides oceani]MDN4174745.1 N-acetylmuramoyl-L-alanine amidase [Nocardioides oceani]
MAYLDDHPNRHLAQQRPRRDEPSGVIVVHTAESALDAIGEDTGAEGVARYISERTTYGSYHRLADSDSVVAVARFEMTTYGDGTGSNDHAIHVSFACRAADWPTMSAERREAFIRNGASAAAEAARWLLLEHGITVPARRITRPQSDQRVPGFIPHGDRDPGRRTDPGPAFPWDHFLTTYADLMEDDDMPKYRDWDDADKKALANDIADAVLARDVDPDKPKLSVRQALRQAANAPGLIRSLGRATGHDVDPK